MIPSAIHAFAIELLESLARTSDWLTVPSERRVVLDTHVLMECFFWEDVKVAPLREVLLSGWLVAMLTHDSFLELSGVLSRPQFGASEATIRSVLERVARCSAFVADAQLDKVTLKVRCRDAEDQKFLVLAAACGAQVLVTRDRLLFKAAKKMIPQGLTPLLPEEFCRQLSNKSDLTH